MAVTLLREKTSTIFNNKIGSWALAIGFIIGIPAAGYSFAFGNALPFLGIASLFSGMALFISFLSFNSNENKRNAGALLVALLVVSLFLAAQGILSFLP